MNFIEIFIYFVIIPITLICLVLFCYLYVKVIKNKKGIVLLVDDDPLILDSLSEFLQERGYRIRRAKNFLEACAIVSCEKKLDYAIVDLDLDDSKTRKEREYLGLEVIKNLRNKFSSVKILPFSGYEFEEVQEVFNQPMQDGEKITQSLIKEIKSNYIKKSEDHLLRILDHLSA